MNEHQVARYIEYRRRDIMRAFEAVGDVDEAKRLVEVMFQAMKIDIKEMW